MKIELGKAIRSKLGRVGTLAGVMVALATGEPQAMAQTPVLPGKPLGNPYVADIITYVNGFFVTNRTLNFSVSGLYVGGFYLVTTMTNLPTAHVKWWHPIDGTGFPSATASGYRWGFIADETNGIWSIPVPQDKMGFFVLWDMDNYDGTVPQIFSPTNGATVSGIMTISGGVADVFELGYEELYVDGYLFTGKSYNGDGTADFSLDTTLLANGSHTIYEGFGMLLPWVYPWEPPTTYTRYAQVSINVAN